VAFVYICSTQLRKQPKRIRFMLSQSQIRNFVLHINAYFVAYFMYIFKLVCIFNFKTKIVINHFINIFSIESFCFTN